MGKKLKRNEKKVYEHLWQGVAGKIGKDEEAWQTAVSYTHLRAHET